MLKQGIIVSIQGYHYKTISELAIEAISGGAVGIRTDKKPFTRFNYPLIGLKKKTVADPKRVPYITPTIEDIKLVSPWAGFVAVDCRRSNKELEEINFYCKSNKIKIVADIQNIEDYRNLKEIGFSYAYIATTFSVFTEGYKFGPNFEVLQELIAEGERKKIIAEGNFQTREQVKQATEMGIKNICIGGAITNVYRLTRKYTTAII